MPVPIVGQKPCIDCSAPAFQYKNVTPTLRCRTCKRRNKNRKRNIRLVRDNRIKAAARKFNP